MNGRGLDIGSMDLKDCASLEKWWCRFGKEVLRSLIFIFKFCEDDWAWVPKSIPRHLVSCLWSILANVGDESKERGSLWETNGL